MCYPPQAVVTVPTCATCNATRALSEDPSDGTWYCQRCWNEWRASDDPLAPVWDTLMHGGPRHEVEGGPRREVEGA